MEYKSTCLCASGKKLKKFNNFLRYRALFGTIFRVMFFKKIREVGLCKLARYFNCFVSEFFWKTACLIRFIEDITLNF